MRVRVGVRVKCRSSQDIPVSDLARKEVEAHQIADLVLWGARNNQLATALLTSLLSSPNATYRPTFRSEAQIKLHE